MSLGLCQTACRLLGLSRAPFMLAELDLDGLAAPQHPSEVLRQTALVCGLALAATLPFVVWAVFFRKRRHGRSRHHFHSSRTPAKAEADRAGHPPVENPTHESAPGSGGKHRKRRRRREHRPLNPTLAQTGGLPPLRSDGPSGPSV